MNIPLKGYQGIEPDEITEAMVKQLPRGGRTAVLAYYRIPDDETIYMEPVRGDPCRWDVAAQAWILLPGPE